MAEPWELYEGIISPSGGLYDPGPEVSFPREPSGLVSRSVTTVPIDDYGNPIFEQPSDPVVAALIQSASGPSNRGR